MKKFTILFLIMAAALSTIVASTVYYNDTKMKENIKLLTTEQLWKSLEEAKDNRLPKTAKPFIEELRVRLTEAKDTKEYLRLRETERMVRNQSYGEYDDKEYTDEHWREMSVKEARSLWFPVRELLLADLYDKSKTDVTLQEILIAHEDELTAVKQSAVFCDNGHCIPSASLYDAVVCKLMAKGDSVVMTLWQKHVEKTNDDISANLLSLYKNRDAFEEEWDDEEPDLAKELSEMQSRSKSETARLLADFAKAVCLTNKAIDTECKTQQQMAELLTQRDTIVAILTDIVNNDTKIGAFTTQAKDLIVSLTRVGLRMYMEKTGGYRQVSTIDPRNKEVSISFKYTNCSKVDLVLYKADILANSNFDEAKRDRYASQVMQAWNGIALAEIGNPLHGRNHEEALKLDKVLPAGQYAIVAYVDDKKMATVTFTMSTLVVSGNSADKKFYTTVSDAQDGSPKKNVQVGKQKTDADGLAVIKGNNARDIVINDGTEALAWDIGYSGSSSKPKEEEYAEVLSDRTIYRPGQTVHFKVWSYKSLNGEVKPNVARSHTITIRTADGRTANVGKFTTNAWGTFSGEYVIPQDAYCGWTELEVDDNCECTFQIDEFKRTNLKPSFLPVEGIIKKGDKVVVRGVVKQVNGNPVANATVQWTLAQEINGTSMTNADGEFSLEMIADRYDYYSINATVTDLKGETEEFHANVVCAEEGSRMNLLCFSEHTLQGNDLKFIVNLDNCNNAPWTSDVTYSVCRLKKEGKGIKDADKVLEQKENVSGTKTISIPTETFAPGGYRLKISTTLADGTISDISRTFYIDPKNDEKVDVYSDFWVIDMPSEAKVGESVHLRLGTGIEDATAYCMLFADGELVSYQHTALHSEVKSLYLPMPKKLPLEGKAQLRAYIVGHGEIHDTSSDIALQEVKPKLPLHLTTSRDISSPRSQEKWTIQLGDSSIVAPEAEILASMYDERLDRLASIDNDWSDFDFVDNRYTPYVSYFVASSIGKYYNYQSHYVGDVSHVNISQYQFPTTKDWSFANMQKNHRIVVRGMASLKSASMMALNVVEESEDAVFYEAEMIPLSKQEEMAPPPPPAPEPESPAPLPREDFSETVFFYPHLTTNKNGKVEFEFTLPDNLTTYKFQALAHTKDMRMAYINHNLSVRKELSVTMGAPRFAVEGDVVTLTALVECYDKSLSSVDCDIVVKDADGKEYISESQQVSLNGSTSAQAAWQISVPVGVDNLSLSVSAKGNNHQDTEITTMQVTKRSVETHESLPFVVIGKNYKNDYKDDAERLERQQKYGNDNLIFKYNSNAFVEVVDALPYLDEEWSKSADTYLGRVESSAIALLVKSRPDVQKAVCGAYKLPRLDNEGYDTPWHSSAVHMDKHTTDIHRVLSGNEAERTLKLSLRKLHDLQKSDGSIAWFPGMEGSDYMTVSVAEMLGRMIQMGLIAGNEEHVSGLCNGAKRYMDKLISKKADEMREHKSDYVSSWTVDLLYARALMPGKMSSDAEYIIGILKKHAQKEMFEPYRIAVATLYNQIGAKAECELLVRSLIENLQHAKPGLASVHVGQFFYPTYAEIHSQSMLTLLLGRMDAMGWNGQNSDLTEVRNQLLNWLIFQKRSTYWRDRQSTSVAVLAIMGANADMVSVDEVKVGSDTYKCTIDEPQLQMKRKTIEPIKVTKTKDYPSWGAWQWTETTPQDELIATGCDELKVARTIFVQRNGKFEKLNGELKVGDVVKVELTLRATVDMSFVHLRDHKAASFEHRDQTSNYVYPLWWWRAEQSVVPHYYQPHDTHIDFFIEHLSKGESKLSYEATVTNVGNISAGFAEVQCTFTPELVAKSAGSRIVISNINK